MEKKIEPEKKLSLKLNFSWNFFGNVLFAFGQWAILALMTKMISVEEVGMFSYAMAFTAPIVLFFQLQLSSIQITDVENEYRFNDYFGFRICTTLIAFLVIVFLSLFLEKNYLKTIIISLVALMKLCDSISDILYGLFQKNEYMKSIAISRIIKSLGTIIIFGCVLYITRNIIISLSAIVFYKILIIILYDLKKSRKYSTIYPIFNLSIFKKIVKVSLPLGLMSLMMSLDANIPKYFIEYFHGVESLGYYSALAYINMAGNQMITAISQAATPRLALLYKVDTDKFLRLLLKLTSIGFVIGVTSVIFVLLFGEQFIGLLYNSDYTQHMDVFLLMMIAGAINYTSSFLGNGMTAARAFKIQPYIGGCWVIISLIASYVFIPIFGLMGGAITMVISALVRMFSKIVVINFLIKNRKN